MDTDAAPTPDAPIELATSRTLPVSHLTAWLDRATTGWEIHDRSSTADSMRQLYPAMVGGRGSALSEFGRRLGHDGLGFSEASGLVAELAAAAPPRATLLEDRPAAVAVAEGWVDGALTRPRPERGPRSAPVLLRLRVAQAYDECRAGSVAAHRRYALGVLEPLELDQKGPGRTLALRVGLRLVREVFNAGQTVAASPRGRIIVLAPRTDALATQLHHLAHQWGDSPVLDGAVRAWVEPLPEDRTLARYLLDDLMG